MYNHRMRLDRWLSRHLQLKRSAVRLLLVQGRVSVDGETASLGAQQVHQFSRIVLDDECLQHEEPLYIMLHKPAGCISATQDKLHPTVMQFLPDAWQEKLHLAGRLDMYSTGLLLLSNDGAWTRRLSHPEHGVEKRYRVTLRDAIDESYIEAFASGMFFVFEQAQTLPAQLAIIDSHTADVTLQEGRYHQIKRMFGQLGNSVETLHRYAVGQLQLPQDLAAGEYREINPQQLFDGNSSLAAVQGSGHY